VASLKNKLAGLWHCYPSALRGRAVDGARCDGSERHRWCESEAVRDGARGGVAEPEPKGGFVLTVGCARARGGSVSRQGGSP
jgi:hypothetical protein